MMPYVLLHWGLFDGSNRAESEESILYLLEVTTDRNCRYLEKHPDTPKLYDSGVVYALPDQMDASRVDDSKLDGCSKYLRKIGASEETIDIVISLLRGIEIFRDIPTVLAKGKVDCDNMAAMRCAELRRAGVKAMPYITWRERPDGTTYHALVRWPDGSSEDPSRLLGLGTIPERIEERRKNHERYDTFVQAAKRLIDDGEMTAVESVQKIRALGLLPQDGSW